MTSFEDQIVALQSYLLKFARLQLRNDAWAEDAVSETVLAALAEVEDALLSRWPETRLEPSLDRITAFLELHVELCARQLYAQAFFGETLPGRFTASVKPQLAANLAAFKRLAVFSPYVAGDTFTMADCAAYTHLPLAALASKIVYGEDLVVAAGIDWKAYSALIGQRPSAQKVGADRKADMERMAAARKA